MCDSTSVSHPNEEKKLSQNSHILLSTRYSLYITGECISEEIITNNLVILLTTKVDKQVTYNDNDELILVRMAHPMNTANGLVLSEGYQYGLAASVSNLEDCPRTSFSNTRDW